MKGCFYLGNDYICKDITVSCVHRGHNNICLEYKYNYPEMNEEKKMTDKEDVKNLRVEIDAIIKKMEERKKEEQPCYDWMARYTLSLRKLQEAKMWLGKCLEAEGSKLPEEFRDEAK